jgi:hypothetical protein
MTLAMIAVLPIREYAMSWSGGPENGRMSCLGLRFLEISIVSNLSPGSSDRRILSSRIPAPWNKSIPRAATPRHMTKTTHPTMSPQRGNLSFFPVDFPASPLAGLTPDPLTIVRPDAKPVKRARVDGTVNLFYLPIRQPPSTATSTSTCTSRSTCSKMLRQVALMKEFIGTLKGSSRKAQGARPGY